LALRILPRGDKADMTRTHIVLLLALVVAVPAAAGSSFFGANENPRNAGDKTRPCFNAGTAAYRFSAAANASYTVRIDNAAAHPDLRLALVDDPALADFVLVDDAVSADACRDAAEVRSIRVDPAAAKTDGMPRLTVTLSKQNSAGDYKIYVRSASFTERDAAALFAAIWHDAHRNGAAVAER
jgi:hypothetical protein